MISLGRYTNNHFFWILLTLFGGYGGGLYSQGIPGLNAIFSGTTKAVILTSITFKADVPVDQRELLYLTDLRTNVPLTGGDIQQAYERLLRKKRFTTVTFALNNRSCLEIHLTSHWLLKKVEVQGIWFGKYRYASLYQQQPGDDFDIAVHEESLKAITSFLHDEGYFASTLDVLLEREPIQKTIRVKLNISRKKQFSIVAADVGFEKNANNIPSFELSALKEELEQKFIKIIPSNFYTKELVEKQRGRIKYFLRKKGFPSSRVRITRCVNSIKGTIELNFKIDLSKKRAFSFSGNKLFTEKFLSDLAIGELQLDWLYDPSIIAERITHEYQARGYRHASVTFSEQQPGVFHFTIVEGKPDKVNAIRIVLSDGKREPSGRYFQEVLTKGVFDEELFAQASQRLLSHYQEQGFWDCTAHRKTVKENAKTVLIITLEKGGQRLLRSVEIVGVAPEVIRHFNAKWGKIEKNAPIACRPEMIRQQRSDVIDYFKEQGYWYVDAQPLFTFTQMPTDKKRQGKRTAIFVDITWKVEPGNQVRFGKVLIRGITKLKFNKILAEVPFKQGDVWDKNKLDLVRSRLKKIDIFKSVSVQPFNLTKKEDIKDVVITLHDDDPIELRLRGGYFLTNKNFMFKRQSTYQVGGSLIVKNPTNGADRLTISGDATRFEQMVDLDYQRPRLFGSQVLSSVKGFTHKYIHPVQLGESLAAYEATQMGVLAGIHSEYKKNYHWGLSVGNEWLKTSKVRGDLKLDPALVNRTLPYFFVEPSLIIDLLDDRLTPSKGGLTFLSFKTMFPEVKGVFTYRMMAEQSLFYPLIGPIVGAVRFRIGHIFRREFDQIMPLERFYLGGPNTVRGYEKDAVPPLGVTEVVNPDNSVRKEFTIQGGSSMVNINLELRFPIYQALGGVIFHDIGSLNQKGFAFVDGGYVEASGFGLRYNTPIGPLRFDIGWKWRKSFEQQNRCVWYLTLGHAF